MLLFEDSNVLAPFIYYYFSSVYPGCYEETFSIFHRVALNTKKRRKKKVWPLYLLKVVKKFDRYKISYRIVPWEGKKVIHLRSLSVQ